MKSTKKILASILSVTLLASVISINAVGLAPTYKENWNSVPYSLGDLDGDCKITTSDARLTLRAAVNIDKLTEEQANAADIFFNGKIVVKNSRKILRKAIGIDLVMGISTLTAADEKRISRDVSLALYAEEASSDKHRLNGYYGTYNGSVAITMGGGISASKIYNPIIETIEGITIEQQGRRQIFVWKDGNVLTLSKAYEQAWLSLENIQSIADIQKNIEFIEIPIGVLRFTAEDEDFPDDDDDFMTDEKIYNTMTIEYDFADDTVLLLLTRSRSWEQYVFTPEDFPEVELTGVENLDQGGREKIETQQALLKSMGLTARQFTELARDTATPWEVIKDYLPDGLLNLYAESLNRQGASGTAPEISPDATAWDVLKDVIPAGLLTDGGGLWLMNPVKYRASLALKLKNPSKENVLKAIHALEKRDDIVAASPDGYLKATH